MQLERLQRPAIWRPCQPRNSGRCSPECSLPDSAPSMSTAVPSDTCGRSWQFKPNRQLQEKASNAPPNGMFSKVAVVRRGLVVSCTKKKEFVGACVAILMIHWTTSWLMLSGGRQGMPWEFYHQ